MIRILHLTGNYKFFLTVFTVWVYSSNILCFFLSIKKRCIISALKNEITLNRSNRLWQHTIQTIDMLEGLALTN